MVQWMNLLWNRVYPFTGLDYRTGLLDWITGLKIYGQKYFCMFSLATI